MSLDKNALPQKYEDIKHISYAGTNVAPHAITKRDSYTIPAGKKGVILGGILFIERVVAASGNARVHTKLNVHSSTASLAVFRNDAVGTLIYTNVPSGAIAKEGQEVCIYTEDAGFDGQCDFICKCMIGILQK